MGGCFLLDGAFADRKSIQPKRETVMVNQVFGVLLVGSYVLLALLAMRACIRGHRRR